MGHKVSHVALAIMARAPILHQCKTRLIPALGSRGALQAHIELVRGAPSRLSDIPDVEVSLWVSQIDASTQAWATEYGLPCYRQQGRDLGERMHHALSYLLGDGASAACLVGTDCPDIDAQYVRQALSVLRQVPVVLGPAEDGGYGLVGLREPCAGLFQDIEWSTERVCAQTLLRAEEQGLEVAQLAGIWDVDRPVDWRRYQRWKTNLV